MAGCWSFTPGHCKTILSFVNAICLFSFDVLSELAIFSLFRFRALTSIYHSIALTFTRYPCLMEVAMAAWGAMVAIMIIQVLGAVTEAMVTLTVCMPIIHQ